MPEVDVDEYRGYLGMAFCKFFYENVLLPEVFVPGNDHDHYLAGLVCGPDKNTP